MKVSLPKTINTPDTAFFYTKQQINKTAVSSPDLTCWYLCSVPTAEAPGDAMSECSGGIQGEGPTLHHMTTKERRYNMETI